MKHECLHMQDALIDSETLECTRDLTVKPCLGRECPYWIHSISDHFDLDKAEAKGDPTVMERKRKGQPDVEPWPTEMPVHPKGDE